MKKIKLGLIYGGVSSEHDISILSEKSIYNALDKDKYEIKQIYINKNNVWYEMLDDKIKIIKNIIDYLKQLDVIFPILHGKNGEDGTIQGMLELFNIPYVGCNILSSSMCMDKVYTKLMLDKFEINQVDYIYLKKVNNDILYINKDFNVKFISDDEIANIVQSTLDYPVFIKPSRQGSSIGINKAKNKDELIKYIRYAFIFDDKVLIEKYVDIIELECAVLNGIPSSIGQIISKDKFYDFDEKYKNDTAKILIPANIEQSISENIKKIASKVFKILDCKDLARIDFFLDKKINKIYVNEINTMPGFTDISMYKKLLEFDGISYGNLLDKLIKSNYNPSN